MTEEVLTPKVTCRLCKAGPAYTKELLSGYKDVSDAMIDFHMTEDEVNDRQYYKSVILVFISVICIIKSWIRTANFTLSESS